MGDAGVVTAWLTGIAAIITAVGVVLKIVTTRPRLPVAEELMAEMAELRAWVVDVASWGHQVAVAAQLAGFVLPHPFPDPPGSAPKKGT